MSNPRVTMRMPQRRIDEFEQLVEAGLFKSRSEAICQLAFRSLDEAKADGPIEVQVERVESIRRVSRPSKQESDLLRELRESGGQLPQAELHERLDTTRSRVSELLAELEELGQVERRHNPSNARAKIVVLPGADDPEDTFYATSGHGRSNGKLHTRRWCWQIASVPDEDIIDGPRSSFDPDQELCSVCGDSE